MRRYRHPVSKVGLDRTRVIIVPVEDVDDVDAPIGAEAVEEREILRQLQIEILVAEEIVRAQADNAADSAADRIIRIAAGHTTATTVHHARRYPCRHRQLPATLHL